MKQLLNELREIKGVSFATVSLDGRAKSRIFDIMDVNAETKTLYFLTGVSKTVLKEIKNNPYVAINVMTPAWKSYRIEGTVNFDVDQTREQLLDLNPSVAALYKDKEQSLVPFAVTITKAATFDLSQDRPQVKNYRLK